MGDLFAGAGYRTAYVGKWHSGLHDARHHPNRRGFAEFAGFLSGIMDYWDWFLDYNGASRRADGRYQTDVFTAEAVDFIRRYAGPARSRPVPTAAEADRKGSGRQASGGARRKPFFLVVAYHAPHSPLQAPEECCRPFRQRGDLNDAVATLYGMVTRMDQGIGQILDALDDAGCTDDTITLVTSDNGPLARSGAPRRRARQHAPLQRAVFAARSRTCWRAVSVSRRSCAGLQGCPREPRVTR